MSRKNAGIFSNRLLDFLPQDEKQYTYSAGELVELSVGDVLCEYKDHQKHIYFPKSGMISLAVKVDEEEPCELAMVGAEGMLGATRVLGASEAPLRGVVLLKGSALRLAVADFDRLSVNGTHMQTIVKRYLFLLMTQSNRTAGCTHFHEVSNRLARWLLMAHDRSANADFHITQQLLSDILGVRRSAVSIAASKLQESGVINYSRGDITIIDRKALESASCSCYVAMMKAERRLTQIH